MRIVTFVFFNFLIQKKKKNQPSFYTLLFASLLSKGKIQRNSFYSKWNSSYNVCKVIYFKRCTIT